MDVSHYCCRSTSSDFPGHLNIIGVVGGNLAFRSNGAIGAGVEEHAPNKTGAELPIPTGKDGL
jgi:hypothetical protein